MKLSDQTALTATSKCDSRLGNFAGVKTLPERKKPQISCDGREDVLHLNHGVVAAKGLKEWNSKTGSDASLNGEGSGTADTAPTTSVERTKAASPNASPAHACKPRRNCLSDLHRVTPTGENQLLDFLIGAAFDVGRADEILNMRTKLASDLQPAFLRGNPGRGDNSFDRGGFGGAHV